MPVGDSAYTTASVTGLFRHRMPQVLSLRWASGDTLGITPAHPFFSTDRGRWVPAGELAVGERVLAKAGTQVLEGTKIWPGERTVYNLEVGGAHNFLVGKGGVVVHNSYISKIVVWLKYRNWRRTHPPNTQGDDTVIFFVERL